MQTIYGYDHKGVFTGETREIEDHEPTYKGWTRTPLPETSEGQVAIWQVGNWSILDEYPQDPPPPVPTTIQRRQGRLALLESGFLDAVEEALEALEDPVQRRAAIIEYEADTWEINNAFLREMWKSLNNGSEEGLDDLFRLAATK